MQQETQVQILRELVDLHTNKAPFVTEPWTQVTPVRYLDVARFRLERERIFQANTPEQESYWRRNHSLTVYTLDEDFELGEAIQRGLDSGANTHLNFGRFEGALAKFNAMVDEAIGLPG